MRKILLSILILILYINSNGQTGSPLRINKFLIDSFAASSSKWILYHDSTHTGQWGAIGSGGGGGGAGTVTSVAQSFTGGLISVAGSPITTSGTLALTVAGTSGGIPYFSSTSTWASSGLLAANAIMIGGGAGTAPSTTTTGTGVLTALGINVGSAGAFVTFNGALGTPSSGTLTNATGLPPTTGIVGWPANASGVLTNNGSGTLSWVAASGTTWNSIGNPTGDQALTFEAGERSTWTDQNTTEDLFTVNNATQTTGSMFSLNRTGTANAAGNNIMELISSGATGTNAITNTALNISVTNTNATSGTNTGISIASSGATTANYAINVSAGQSRFITGSGTVPSILLGADVGIYNFSSVGVGFHDGTIARAIVGSLGFLVRDGATAIFDMGNSGTLGGTNRFRLNAPAVGTMQLGMETTQQSMIFKGANNAGTDAAGFNMTYQPGAGTGTSTSAGTLIFQTPDATVSGTTVQTYSTKFTVGRFGGVWASRNTEFQGTDVASAAGAITLSSGNTFEITGTEAITLISNVNWQNGSIVHLIFTSTASVASGTSTSGTDITIILAGGATFNASANDVLTLVLSEVGGTQAWREVSRSVN